MGEKPSLSYRQSTGYHSYMFPNNIAFCRPCLSSFIDPRPLVGRSGSVVLCTAGLEDMAVALSPGKCGSYRQILSNNSVSRWLRCRVDQTREIGPTRLSNALTSRSTSLILGTSTTICKTSKCGRGQPITLPL